MAGGTDIYNRFDTDKNMKPKKDYLKSINMELIKLNAQFEKFLKMVEESRRSALVDTIKEK